MPKRLVAFLQRCLRRWARPKRSERRAGGRRLGSPAASCHLTATLLATPLAARVRNLSATGISLLLERDFEPDTILNIELANSNRSCTCTLDVRVVYTIQHPCGEWILGGAFTRKLREDELQALL
jgi:hypothetical protein